MSGDSPRLCGDVDVFAVWLDSRGVLIRNALAVASAFVLLTLNLSGAPRNRDVVPLRNWPVPHDAAQFRAVANPALAGSVPAHFVAVAPCRLVDTRNADGPYGGPTFTANETRHYIIPGGGCGVPTGSAYSLNFTIVNYTGRGNLRAFPTGSSVPLVSSLNFGTGLPLANAAIVPADSNGSIDVLVTGPTNVVIDINGYFEDEVVTKVSAGTGITVTGTNDYTVNVDPNVVQQRVTGTCGPLSGIVTVNGNGSVACGVASGTQLFSPGTYMYTVPAGASQLIIEMWGGGGGGAGYQDGINLSGGGAGGGGGYARALLQVSPGLTLMVIVGAGGQGGMDFQVGQTGQASSIAVGNNTLLSAAGGAGGSFTSGGLGGAVTHPGVNTLFQRIDGTAGTNGGNNGQTGTGGAAGLNGGTLGTGGNGGGFTISTSGQPGMITISVLAPQ